MPTIQSRKYPDNEQFVTAKDWKEMEEKGFARRFKIVDDGDMQDTVIATPLSFTDFSKPLEVINNNVDNLEEIFPYAGLSRDDLKEWLDKREIEYNPRTPTDKLYQLYLDNQ